MLGINMWQRKKMFTCEFYFISSANPLNSLINKSDINECIVLTFHRYLPFRPLCRSNRQIDLTEGSFPLYRQESARLSEDDVLKHLLDISRPEKVSKMVAIPGNLTLALNLADSKEKIEGVYYI